MFEHLSRNQLKIINALLENPEGLISKELAEKTGVSNKSATITPEVRDYLLENGYELKIFRQAGNSLWALTKTKEKKSLENLALYLEEMADELRSCEMSEDYLRIILAQLCMAFVNSYNDIIEVMEE